MRTLKLLLLIVACSSNAAMGVFKFNALLVAPRAEEIGEVMFDRSDWHANDSETTTMLREEFLRFFTNGTFQNDGKYIEIIYRSGKFAEPKNKKGGWIYCSGAFATKDGKVFKWNRCREGVLEIEDVQHRTGWLIIVKSSAPETVPQR